MKFSVQHDENDTDILVEQYGETAVFTRTTDNSFNATLIAIAIDEAMAERVRSIRRVAYEQGRRSVRNKSKVCTEFDSCINSTRVGW